MTEFVILGLILMVIKRSLNAIRVIFSITANFSPNLEFNSGNRLFSSESEIHTADISATGEDRTKIKVENELPGFVLETAIFGFLEELDLVRF